MRSAGSMKRHGGGRLITRLDSIEEQVQPAAEMLRLDPFERLMRLLHVAAVLLCAQHETRPERAHLRQMLVPAAGQLRIENRPEQRIVRVRGRRKPYTSSRILASSGSAARSTTGAAGKEGFMQVPEVCDDWLVACPARSAPARTAGNRARSAEVDRKKRAFPANGRGGKRYHGRERPTFTQAA